MLSRLSFKKPCKNREKPWLRKTVKNRVKPWLRKTVKNRVKTVAQNLNNRGPDSEKFCPPPDASGNFTFSAPLFPMKWDKTDGKTTMERSVIGKPTAPLAFNRPFRYYSIDRSISIQSSVR